MVNICNTGFMNCSQIIGQVIITTSDYTTGSLFLTFLFVMLFLITVAILFKIKLEYTMLLIMPLLLAFMSYYQDFIAFGGVILIYLGIILTKHFILK